MLVKHSERIPGIGFVYTYIVRRCDDCGSEETIPERYAAGNLIPDGWTRFHLPSTPRPGFALQRDRCPTCSAETSAV